MADSVYVPNTNGQLSCSICQRQISEMTLSSCFHTFCPQCLYANASKSARTGQYECPICQTPINLPANSKLRTEERRGWTVHRVSTRASTRYGEAHCDVCGEDRLATNHCLVCKEVFCDPCTKAHMKMRVSRYHADKVVPLKDDIPTTPLAGSMDKYCPRHMNQEILFICKQCNVMACNICKLMEHENHVTRLVSEEAGTLRQELQTLLYQQNNELDTIQSKLQVLQHKQRQYPTVLEQEIEKVRQQATRVHIDIDREKTDKERELEDHFNTYIDRANVSRQSLSKDYEERAALVRQAEQLLDTDEDVRFVKDGNMFCKKLQNNQAEGLQKFDHEDQPYKKFVPKSIDSRSQPLVGIISGDKIAKEKPQSYKTASPVRNPPKPAVQAAPPTYKQKTGGTQNKFVKPLPSSSPKQGSPVRQSVYSHKSTPLYNTPISPITYVSTPHMVVPHEPQQNVRSSTQSQHSRRSSTISGPFAAPPDIPSEPIQLTQLSSFTILHDDINGYIYGIAPIAGEELAWVSMLDHHKIVLVDKEGQIRHAVSLGEPCEGVTSDTNGGCYVTCPQSKSIYYVKRSGQVMSVVTNLALHPHGMAGWQYHDNRRNTTIEELFVCFTDSRKASLYEKPKGSIGIFSFFGQDLGKAFNVGSPVRIDVDLTTKMLCISDHMNGCVIICDKTGQYTTALYTGEEQDELFKPLGVCFDDTSHVIIADWAGSKVRRVSLDGRLVQDLLTDLDGPQTVAMGDNGLLWVGSKKGRVSVYKTK